jgi:hypothetical protein
MTINVKDGGAWKEASLFVRDGGTWKTVNEGYIKDSGTWKQFFVNRVSKSITISSDTANYTLNTAKVTGYVAGKTDVTLTINSGVTVYSGSTGSYAFTVDTSWASGDTVTIINNGTIIGRGGNGGNGRFYSVSEATGSSGGGALYVQRATSINNVNRISGGGGGGAGGNGDSSVLVGESFTAAGGGGGGGGIGLSSGGLATDGGTAGQAGTLTSAGAGGARSTYGGGGTSTNGGNGGSYGSSGSSTSYASGGASGAAVVGNSNITWIATGTRNGSIS